MARTSKRNQEAFHAPAGREPEKIYSAGIYARLSVDADERKNESIETQIEIAKEFIRGQADMAVYSCYTDIGKTGTSFAREGFARMMQDVRMHKINCIVVKDLSRFGRNHVETGNYIEKIFPFLGVRFIAVTDNFDSMDVSGKDEALGVSLKNLVNEMYAKDIAMKVRSSRRAKWEQGSYTGGIPPYGYRAEWVGDKKCLFIEEDAAEVVRKIFHLFLSGKNMSEIARWLYGNRILRPAQYHKTGRVYCKEGEEPGQWTRAAVKMILTNPSYMGCLVQGQTCGESHRLRSRHDMDSGDWSVKEHTHEAIIPEESFFEAAGKFERNSVYCNKNGFSKKIPLDADIFADVLYCGVCGGTMKRISAVREFSSKDKARIYSYRCPKTVRADRLSCEVKSITLCSLTDIVKEAVRQEMALSATGLAKLTEISNQKAEVMKAECSRRLAALERKAQGITRLGSELYLKYRMGEMDEERFRRAKEENGKKADAIQKKRDAVAERLRAIDAETVRKIGILRDLAEGSGKMELKAEEVCILVNRIEIYPDHRVRIVFAFKRRGVMPV